MAFKAGTVSFFMLDSAAGALVNLSPYIDDTQVPQTTQMLDVSTFGTGAKAFIPGLTNGDTIALKGPYDITLHNHMTAAKGSSDAAVSLSMLWGPGGSVSTQAKITSETFLANYQVGSGVGGRVEWTASLQITGAVTNSTF